VKNELGRAFSAHEGRIAYRILVENLRETDHLGNPEVDARTAFVKEVMKLRFT